MTKTRRLNLVSRRRGLFTPVLLTLVLLVAAACGDDDDGDEATTLLQRARAEGITLGIADERPYGYQDPQTGEPTGQAPTVAKEVLSRMGIDTVEGAVVDFGALINGLNATRFDMISAGMFITEQRASQALFTDPDYCGTTAFAVPEGNPKGLTDFESVVNSDAVLGVLSGAVEDGYAVDSGVPEERISRFDTTADMVDALTSGRIDAFALTAITVREQTANLPGFEATQGFIPVINGEEQLGCGGYVFRFDNIEFRDEFNRILNEMKEADEILALVEPFGFSAEEVDAAKGVTVMDLIGKPYDFAVNGNE